MFKLNKKTEYALMAIKYLHDSEKELPVSVREISSELAIPFDTTAKVLQALNNQGIISSIQGINGGHFLSTDLRSVSFKKFTEVVENQEIQKLCITEKGKCKHYETCNIISPVETLNEYIINYLDQISIFDLLVANNFTSLYKKGPGEFETLAMDKGL
jgi:Rrf2 family transcriptional regulator, nitric oxide-sensitive transcriptional repressor